MTPISPTTADFQRRTGIVLYLFPSEPTADIQIQRANDDGAGDPSTTTIDTVAVLDPDTRIYVDDSVHPGDGRKHYRFRHQRGDCTVASSYGGWYDDLPTEIGQRLPPIPGLDAPIVELKPSQNGSTGVFELQITDRDLVTDKADFATKAGATDFGSFSTAWDGSTGVIGDDQSVRRTEKVTLGEKHNVAVKARVEYTDRNNSQQIITRENTFDIDTIPEVNQLTVGLTTGDNVAVEGRRDEDGAKTYITATVDGSKPATPSSGTADISTTDRAWDNLDTGVSVSSTVVTLRARARAETAGGVLASTNFITGAINHIRRGDAGNRPEVKLSVSQANSTSGSTGTYRLEIRDFDQFGTKAEFAKKDGSTGFNAFSTGWDTATGTFGASTDLVREEKVTLLEKHNVGVKSRVSYESRDGTTQFITNEHTFDIDQIAEIQALSMRIDDDGSILTSGRRDEDGTNVYFTVTTDDTEPADPTTGNFDQSTASLTWTNLDTTVDAQIADQVQLKGRAKGPQGFGPVVHLGQKEPTGTAAPTVNITPSDPVAGDGLVDITLDAEAGQGGSSTSLQVAYDICTDTTGCGGLSAWQDDPHTISDVSRKDSDVKAIKAKARDTSLGNLEGPWAIYMVSFDLPIPEFGSDLPASSGSGASDTIDKFIQKLQTTGNLDNTARQGTTSSSFSLNRHTESNTQQDGDTVSYQQSYSNTPKVTFVPQSGLAFKTSFGSSADQKINMTADNPTVSGFDMNAIIKKGETTTAQTDGFSSTQNTSAPENGDVTTSGDGATAFSNLEDTTSDSITYTVYYDIDSNGEAGNSFDIVLEYNDGATSTTWTEADRKSYGGSVSLDDETLQFAGTLGADYDLRLRIVVTGGNYTETGEFVTLTAHGEDNTEPGVQYSTPSGGSEATMTPDTGDSVRYESKEVS